MPGWIGQWNGYEPVVRNGAPRSSRTCPFEITGALKGEPASETTPWARKLSRLAKVTSSPWSIA